MAAPKPKPTALKLVAGNPGKRKLPKNEPKPKRALKRRPRWFDKRHADAWDAVCEEVPHGLLRQLDGEVLESWVVAKLQFTDATIALRGEPLVVIGEKMDRMNPLIGVQHRAIVIMLKAASELGFTPASRAKIETLPVEDDEDENNPFAVGNRKQA